MCSLPSLQVSDSVMCTDTHSVACHYLTCGGHMPIPGCDGRQQFHWNIVGSRNPPPTPQYLALQYLAPHSIQPLPPLRLMVVYMPLISTLSFQCMCMTSDHFFFFCMVNAFMQMKGKAHGNTARCTMHHISYCLYDSSLLG